jgi:hypothetical protein
MMKKNVDSEDPFTGTWNLSVADSHLPGLAPIHWTQDIDASAQRIRVKENIVSADGGEKSHVVDAQFDGVDYPVSGSPLVDTIAYTRPGPYRIEGTARKAGSVIFTEVVIDASDLSSLTMTFSIRGRGGHTANNIAVFIRRISES